MAVFNINNRSDIQKMVKQINKEMRISIELSLMQIAETVKEVWKDFVNAFWYGIYDPIVYKRTYETLNSIVTSSVSKVGDIYMVSIFYDTSLINTFQYGNYTGHENPDLMPYLIEEGVNFTIVHQRA